MSKHVHKRDLKRWWSQPSTKGALFNVIGLALLGGSAAVPAAADILLTAGAVLLGGTTAVGFIRDEDAQALNRAADRGIEG